MAKLAKAVETEGWVPKVQPLGVAAYPSMMHDFNTKAEDLLKQLEKDQDKNATKT